MKTAVILGSFFVVVFAASAVFYRIIQILPGKKRKLSDASINTNAHLMVFLGSGEFAVSILGCVSNQRVNFFFSGGHTGEMFRLLKDVDFKKYSRRTWIYHPEDEISGKRALEFEHVKTSSLTDQRRGKVSFETVRRARDVGEGIASSVKSTYTSFRSCVEVMNRYSPDVVSS